MQVLSSIKVALVLATNALAAVNYPTIPSDLTTPFQQRLAIYGPNSVSVGWNTYAKQSSACVAYGTSSSSLSKRACSTSPSTTYGTSRTYGNVVILTGLTPATTYYYKIESTNSSIEHFLSPRKPGDKTPFSMNAVIDLGVYGENGYTVSAKRDTIPIVDPALTHATIGRLATTVNDYDFIIHPGDFAYADDWFLTASNLLHGTEAYQSILENFYGQLAPITGRKPYMAGPGNHEAACQEIPFTSGLCPDGQKNFTDFLHRFGRTMPSAFSSVSPNISARALASQAEALAQPPFWYSFEYGMAHIVMINTETDFEDAPDTKTGSAHLGAGPFGYSGQQLDFLAADLASVDRTVTPWVIVAGHRPWYTEGGGCDSCQDAFEDLLYTYGVDLGVFGHEHNSQRFLPVYDSVADPNGMHDPKAPMYIVAGGAGNIEGLSSITSISTPDFAEFTYDEDYSYAKIKFLDAQNLQVDFIRSATGEVLDSSILYKSHSTAFVRQ